MPPPSRLALGVLLLTDVLRVWLPSIITIFGQAASTPAELMGAFALLWFLVAFAAPPLVRVAGSRPVALVAAVVLAGCRIALLATGGGQLQLYVASAGLLAGLVWLAATAATVADPAPGMAFGLALGTLVHTAVGHLRPDLARRCPLLGVGGLAARWLSWPRRPPTPTPTRTAARRVVRLRAGSPAVGHGRRLAGVGRRRHLVRLRRRPGSRATPVRSATSPVAVLIAVSSALFVVAALSGIRHRARACPPASPRSGWHASAAFAWIGLALLWTAMPLTAVGLGVVLGRGEPRGRRAGAGAGSRRSVA